ncbi:MAG TPA: hypothetical protein VJ949_02290 [Cryomorphaceae bacterium]|nr:hypothetical protein [Cryomorphaceae bacterium]
MENRYDVHRGPSRVNKRQVEPSGSGNPASFDVSPLGVSMGLTPRIKSLNSFHLFRITLAKQITDLSNGKILVDLEMEFPYALDLPDEITPTVEEIFDLMNYASLDFAANWYQLLSDTQFENHRLSDMFEFDPLKKKIEKTIDFWEDSLRDKTLD